MIPFVQIPILLVSIWMHLLWILNWFIDPLVSTKSYYFYIPNTEVRMVNLSWAETCNTNYGHLRCEIRKERRKMPDNDYHPLCHRRTTRYLFPFRAVIYDVTGNQWYDLIAFSSNRICSRMGISIYLVDWFTCIKYHCIYKFDKRNIIRCCGTSNKSVKSSPKLCFSGNCRLRIISLPMIYVASRVFK